MHNSIPYKDNSIKSNNQGIKPDRATALVCNSSKVLMMHRFKNGSEYFVLPGGSVESGESIEQAVIRELNEETSLVSEIIEKVFEAKDSDGINHIVYLCKYISGNVELKSDSIEVQYATKDNIYIPEWVDIKRLKDLTIWSIEVRNFLNKYFDKEVHL